VSKATVPEVQAAMNGGTLTAEELTLYFLSRIRQHDEWLRSETHGSQWVARRAMSPALPGPARRAQIIFTTILPMWSPSRISV
jgi:hypothetical protein